MRRCSILVKIIVTYLLLQGTASACEWRDELEKSASKDTIVVKIRETAFGGDTSCQTYLAGLYYWGVGVPSNQTLARRWYFVAALAGDKDAYSALIPLFGISEPQRVYDPVLAYALVYSTKAPSNDRRDVLDSWASKMNSAYDREEAIKFRKLLEKTIARGLATSQLVQ